jgi:antitoxin (DNA-binding transcriptional repressor) of toxin-antitoxin stability system
VKTVKIAELKNRLSHYLRLVQRGEAILVCERDRVIARIDRVIRDDAASESDAAWLDRLERRGIIHRGTGNVSRRWVARRPKVTADVVAALLRERHESP